MHVVTAGEMGVEVILATEAAVTGGIHISL